MFGNTSRWRCLPNGPCEEIKNTYEALELITDVSRGFRGPGRGAHVPLCTERETCLRPMECSTQRRAGIWRGQGVDPGNKHVRNVLDASHDAGRAQRRDLQGSDAVLEHLLEMEKSGEMAFRPAARLRWTPACRRACATSEGGGEQSAVRRKAGRLQTGPEARKRTSRGDEGSCPRGRLPGPRRRLDRLTGVGSRLHFSPGRLIGLQNRIPLVGGAAIAHYDGCCGTDADRMGCIGIRSAAVGSGKLRGRRSSRV